MSALWKAAAVVACLAASPSAAQDEPPHGAAVAEALDAVVMPCLDKAFKARGVDPASERVATLLAGADIADTARQIAELGRGLNDEDRADLYRILRLKCR